MREYNLTIWNRWGELIFETDEEDEGWDGILSGTQVQDGVYIWRSIYKPRVSWGGRRCEVM
ncbi:MAG: gliding motility-associated C-terminal domain-containing protein [Flavobacteriales bacterium]|nr:gliding motility-associated C-terminal domain-containing protein [Flavobacteriales bacterium]